MWLFLLCYGMYFDTTTRKVPCRGPPQGLLIKTNSFCIISTSQVTIKQKEGYNYPHPGYWKCNSSHMVTQSKWGTIGDFWNVLARSGTVVHVCDDMGTEEWVFTGPDATRTFQPTQRPTKTLATKMHRPKRATQLELRLLVVLLN